VGYLPLKVCNYILGLETVPVSSSWHIMPPIELCEKHLVRFFCQKNEDLVGIASTMANPTQKNILFLGHIEDIVVPLDSSLLRLPPPVILLVVPTISQSSLSPHCLYYMLRVRRSVDIKLIADSSNWTDGVNFQNPQHLPPQLTTRLLVVTALSDVELDHTAPPCFQFKLYHSLFYKSINFSELLYIKIP